MTQLHSAEDAVKQAEKGGYDYKNVPPFFCPYLDPSWWQALAIARKWNHCMHCDGSGWTGSSHDPNPCSVCQRSGIKVDWMDVALRYFETVLSGGDLKVFWESLP